MQPRAHQKRERFVAAAARVIHRQGFARTTLADIATEAAQPTGSLYYYFRTKEAVVSAVVDARLAELRARIAQWERDPEPRRRLGRLLRAWAEEREVDARFGCPTGSLCYELGKAGGAPAAEAARPLAALLQWCQAQFAALGETPARARDRAAHLVAGLQGIALLANALGDPDMILRHTRELERWLDA